MDDLQNRYADAPAGEQLSEGERARVITERIRAHFEEGEIDDALDLFNRLHPADQGDVLVALYPESKDILLDSLDPEDTAQVLEHLEPEEAARVIEDISGEDLSTILGETGPDVAADIIKQLPEHQSLEVLDAMIKPSTVMSLLRYPDETAGGLMTTDFPSVRENITAANALDILRIQGSLIEHVGSLFVVDNSDRLIGSMSVTRLALSRPTMLISDIMDKDVISVPVETDQEECARLMDRYNLNYLPVVEQSQQLVGLILVEDVVDVLRKEATEDMYRISSLGQGRLFDPLRRSVSHRLPWLYINLGTTILAALVINLFASTIEKLVILAAFLPVIAGQGGIGGTQTLTLVVRGLTLGEIFGSRGRQLLARELALGIIHGLALGLLIGLIAYAWQNNPMLGVVIGVAMLGNMIVAGLTGAGIPLMLRRFGMDPAVSSAVFVTTVTDIFGFMLFLGMASALMRFLL